jgi:hypothetical protein
MAWIIIYLFLFVLLENIKIFPLLHHIIVILNLNIFRVMKKLKIKLKLKIIKWLTFLNEIDR